MKCVLAAIRQNHLKTRLNGSLRHGIHRERKTSLFSNDVILPHNALTNKVRFYRYVKIINIHLYSADLINDTVAYYAESQLKRIKE